MLPKLLCILLSFPSCCPELPKTSPLLPIGSPPPPRISLMFSIAAYLFTTTRNGPRVLRHRPELPNSSPLPPRSISDHIFKWWNETVITYCLQLITPLRRLLLYILLLTIYYYFIALSFIPLVRAYLQQNTTHR